MMCGLLLLNVLQYDCLQKSVLVKEERKRKRRENENENENETQTDAGASRDSCRVSTRNYIE